MLKRFKEYLNWLIDKYDFSHEIEGKGLLVEPARKMVNRGGFRGNGRRFNHSERRPYRRSRSSSSSRYKFLNYFFRSDRRKDKRKHKRSRSGSRNKNHRSRSKDRKDRKKSYKRSRS